MITLNYEPAIGATLEEMRDNISGTPLYNMGDMKLIWVNEGDLAMLDQYSNIAKTSTIMDVQPLIINVNDP